LNREQGRTVLMVIHDLNHAARFSHYMIALNQGKVIKDGTPHEVMTKEVLSQVFHIDAEIVLDPRTNKPICLTYDLMN
ncbi:ABC transporter ATP-binding protein, partial [Bacillus cereus]